MSNASTIPIQKTINFCSTQADLLPLCNVGGYQDEPALTLANDALSDIFTDPNDYVFNRVEMPPVFTCPNKQDYLFAGATAFTLQQATALLTPSAYPSQGWAIDLAANNAITVTQVAGSPPYLLVTVNTLEPHRFVVGQTVYMTGVQNVNYNSIFSDNGSFSNWSNGWPIVSIPTPTSFTFIATAGMSAADVTGAPGIFNFAYATSASLTEVNNNTSPPNVRACTARRELAVSSRVSDPENVSVIADLGNGIIKVRFLWVPGGVVWACNIVYQAKPPLKVALTDTWAPVPDNFIAVINQAMVYRMYRYLNDARADNEYKKLQAEISKTQAADDATATDVNVQPPCLMDDSTWSGY